MQSDLRLIRINSMIEYSGLAKIVLRGRFSGKPAGWMSCAALPRCGARGHPMSRHLRRGIGVPPR